MLYEAGIAVAVPAPARYVVHTLIASTLRLHPDGQGKMGNDTLQASTFVAAFALTNWEPDLGLA